MIKRLPSKKEQIEYLMTGRAQDLILECVDFIDIDVYDCDERIKYRQSIFTVTRSEVLDYVKKHYKVEDFINEKINDGLNICRKGGGYYCFYYDMDFAARIGADDPDVIIGELFFDNEDDVLEEVVDYFLEGSGTGLDFNDKDPESEH